MESPIIMRGSGDCSLGGSNNWKPTSLEPIGREGGVGFSGHSHDWATLFWVSRG